ncbi:MAG: GTP 3',8-cyclase MoaA [Gallionella sp.]
MTHAFRIIPIPSGTPDCSATNNNQASHLTDTLHRPLHDLRISVTDRCNLRCTYCMPREVFDDQHVFLPRTELLSFEEIERLARILVDLGVRKIRLTGGEPLLRRRIEQLIEKLASLHTPQGEQVQVALTTNGVLLAKKARALKEAGLSRVTVSLDGLSAATFQQMSDSKVSVQTVLDGIYTAQAAGLAPVKVNMVVKRGVNEHEIVSMARHFRHSGVLLRFIEYMDVGNSNGWRMDEVVTAQDILARIAAHFPLQAMDANYTGEVAARWQYADGAGEIGVIASVTQAFCHECSRLRLSTDGKIYTCLFAHNGLDLRTPLRSGANDHLLHHLITHQWTMRDDRYSQLRHLATHRERGKVEMSYIGG